MLKIGLSFFLVLVLIASSFGAATCPPPAGDKRIYWCEKMVGYGHASLADTLNDLTLQEHGIDGKHTTGSLTDATGILTFGSPGKLLGGNSAITFRKATGSVAGYLDAADFVKFNLAYTNRIETCIAPLVCNDSTQVGSIVAASAGVAGYLTAADRATFVAKQDALTRPVTSNTTTNTSGYLTKWTAGNAYKLEDGLLLGTMTDTKWCTYGTATGITCNSSTPSTFNGPAGATTTGYIPQWDGTTSNKLSTGLMLDTDITLAANSTTRLVDQHAIKTYIDNRVVTQNYGVTMGADEGINLKFGVDPLYNKSTGLGNQVFGYRAGYSITTGSHNQLFGANVGSSLTTGGSNALFGSGTGFSLTSTDLNSFFGNSAGSANTGTDNAYFGGFSGASNTGSYNSYFGTFAGRTGTGSSNVFLGFQAGYYETASNKLFIDNVQRASEADGRAKALIYGDFASTVVAQQLTVNAGNVYVPGHIQTTAQTTSLAVSTCGTTPAVTGTDNAFTVTTGSTATTACTITFATTWTNTPRCVVTPVGVTTAIGITSTNTTTIVFQYGSSTSLVYNVLCF